MRCSKNLSIGLESFYGAQYYGSLSAGDRADVFDALREIGLLERCPESAAHVIWPCCVRSSLTRPPTLFLISNFPMPEGYSFGYTVVYEIRNNRRFPLGKGTPIGK